MRGSSDSVELQIVAAVGGCGPWPNSVFRAWSEMGGGTQTPHWNHLSATSVLWLRAREHAALRSERDLPFLDASGPFWGCTESLGARVRSFARFARSVEDGPFTWAEHRSTAP